MELKSYYVLPFSELEHGVFCKYIECFNIHKDKCGETSLTFMDSNFLLRNNNLVYCLDCFQIFDMVSYVFKADELEVGIPTKRQMHNFQKDVIIYKLSKE